MKKFLRKLKHSWFPASIFLGMFLCWYLLHLIQNTPGRDIDLEMFKKKDSPIAIEGSPDLRIIVLAFNRSESLKRLLMSLSSADYMGEKVVLDIWIDRTIDGQVINNTVKTATDFSFKFGEKSVYIHKKHRGVLNQWLGTWNYETFPDEICVFLEDDMVVSPHFYHWLKTVHRTYGGDDRISGFTLQGSGTIHSGKDALKPVIVEQKHPTFLYSMPGTWGFSPRRELWEKFISWYEEASKEKEFHPIIPNDIATDWYSENRKKDKLENMWSMWYIYYNWKFKKYVLYPNIQPSFQGFSLNYKEPGVNSYGHAKRPASGTLLLHWSPIYETLPSIPPIVLTNGTVVYELNKKISV